MRIVRILLLVLLLFCTLFFGLLIRSRAWGKHFQSLHVGDSRETVLQHAGPPARTMPCSTLSEPLQGCADVLVYAGPLAGIMPEYWLIPLDAGGHVLRVLHTTRAD